jgi:hypothetical protein
MLRPGGEESAGEGAIMKILEVIHLRMMGDEPEDLAELVRAATENVHDAVEARVYRHARLEGDLLIHLHRNKAQEGVQMSSLGLRLASILRSRGLVDHSVWTSCEGHGNSTEDHGQRGFGIGP